MLLETSYSVTSWDSFCSRDKFPSYRGPAVSSVAHTSWTRGQVRGSDGNGWYLDVRALSSGISLKENENNTQPVTCFL